MIPFDELRKEVAIRHNVLLSPDDPILVTVTLNELVLQAFLERASKDYTAANAALTVSLQQQVEQSKDTAGKIVTDSANYVRGQVQQAVTLALTDAGLQIRKQVADAQEAGRAAVTSGRDAQAAKVGAYLAAALAGVAALVAVATAVVVLVK